MLTTFRGVHVNHHTTLWLVFTLLMGIMISFDLGLSRKSREISFRESLAWTIIWFVLAMLFNAGVYLYLGSKQGVEFFTGYIIEKSLSVDNLFVFIMIFSYFGVERLYQPKILKWGIMGALVMRGLFIFLGVELLNAFSWMMYVFGLILVVTAFKMAFGGEEEIEPEKNLLVRLARRLYPVVPHIRNDRFFVTKSGVRHATPLLLTVLVVESSDVIFAIDSIPAIFAVTRDPFIVYTSNIFAIMGLRALFFLLSGATELFEYLKFGISLILAFVGVKMLIVDFIHIPNYISLLIIIVILSLSIIMSVSMKKRQRAKG
jgi:tellurite resistance protein TerC